MNSEKSFSSNQSYFNEVEIKPRKIRIIVPFYENPQLVRPLFSSMLETADELNRLGCKISFINDSKWDDALRKELEECKKSHASCLNLSITTNPRNLGFIKSVNKAFSAAVKNDEDIIVLNSDTVLTKGAVTELFQIAYSDPMIGFVSPRSNNATICTLPHGSESLDLPPSECAARHKKLIPHLPRVSYVPTAVGFCLYIKSAIIREFGGFDLVYQDGYNEENDLIMRANRCGYRAALANHAFVWHKGEQSFASTPIPRSLRQRDNAKILNARYPEYQTLIDQYFQSAEYSAEGLLGSLIPDVNGRLTIGFDFSNFGSNHNGTFEAGKRLLFAACEVWPANIRIVVFMDHTAWEFHALSNCKRAEWVDTHNPGCRAAAIVRMGQPFDADSVRRMVVRAPVVSSFMLDTISADCGYLVLQFDLTIWRFVLQWCDVIFTNSKFTAKQLQRRFVIGDNTQLYPSIHSINPVEYLRQGRQSTDIGEQTIGHSILVIGNHFAHKALAPTVKSLAEAFPNTQVIALGLKEGDRPNVQYLEGGVLSDEEADLLYSRVSAIVFPSHYEGFGMPILNALARGKPIYVRKLAPFEEIVSKLRTGRKNVRWFESIDDLIGQLSGGIGPWSGQAARGESNGWHRSSTEVLKVIERRLKAVRQEFLAERLSWLRVVFPRYLPRTQEQRRSMLLSPGDAAAQLMVMWAEPALRSMLANRFFYSALRSSWRIWKFFSGRTHIAGSLEPLMGEQKLISTTTLISTAAIANLLMVTPTQLQQLAREGYIAQAGEDQWRLADVVQGYVRYFKDEARRSSKTAQSE